MRFLTRPLGTRTDVALGRAAALALLFCTASSCQALFPFAPENMTETRIRAVCHFVFNCCTPVEAATYLYFIGSYKDEGTCVSELLEDDQASSFYQTDQYARDTIARDAGTYDAEAAEECAREWLDAVNSCDIDKLTTPNGSIDIVKVALLVDSEDAECVALSQRGYVRGNVGDGDDCESHVDCEDFGICEVDEDEDAITIAGECRALSGKGADCTDEDFNGCQPGLTCVAGDDGITCETPELLDDGDPCDDDSMCDSGYCDFTQTVGVCFDAGTPCTDDADCDEANGDFCDIGFGGACAAPDSVKVEICDGT